MTTCHLDPLSFRMLNLSGYKHRINKLLAEEPACWTEYFNSVVSRWPFSIIQCLTVSLLPANLLSHTHLLARHFTVKLPVIQYTTTSCCHQDIATTHDPCYTQGRRAAQCPNHSPPLSATRSGTINQICNSGCGIFRLLQYWHPATRFDILTILSTGSVIRPPMGNRLTVLAGIAPSDHSVIQFQLVVRW